MVAESCSILQLQKQRWVTGGILRGVPIAIYGGARGGNKVSVERYRERKAVQTIPLHIFRKSPKRRILVTSLCPKFRSPKTLKPLSVVEPKRPLATALTQVAQILIRYIVAVGF